jgi:hypothetical protein
MTPTTASLGSAHKVAVTSAVSDQAIILDGVVEDTGAGGSPAGTDLDTLGLFALEGASNINTGILKYIYYVPRRKTDSELQTETT